MGLSEFDPAARERVSWNAERKVGAKRALKHRQIWAIRFFLDQYGHVPDRALFDLAIDSKLRGCDLVNHLQGDPQSSCRPDPTGYTKIENMVRYLGVDGEDALTLAEGNEI
ncbi:hypothetical protein J2W40_004098 [Sphingobium xenophagum]|uniref:Integrase n=1 Tax=Sphingobium xenophagum TaxID=121428 RepID=A0ABU1X6N4_SPHXE|nr:hypothetical protein [Sphingobium xenophagum]MDR7157250.1 hypothetical protein [Sphingobium xenophagum]